MSEFVIQSHAWANALDSFTGVYLGSGDVYKNRAFGFVSGVEDTKLAKVKFVIKSIGTPPGDVYVDIFDLSMIDLVADDKPGSKLATKQVTGITSSYAENEVDFTSDNITLQPLKQYWICFRCTDYNNTSNCFNLAKGLNQSASIPANQMGQGDGRSYASCYGADQVSWTNSATDFWLALQITGVHDETKALWSNNSTVLDKNTFVRYGYDDNECTVGWKITTPNDGKYRQIENIAAAIRNYDDVGESLMSSISIHEDVPSDSTSNPGDMILNGMCSVSRLGGCESSAVYLPIPTMYRWDAERRPVLAPSTTYWFMFSPSYQGASDYTAIPTDSANGGDGELYLFNVLGNQTKVDNWGLFYIHGKELDADPNVDDGYTYPSVLYSTTGPPAYLSSQNIGNAANSQNIGYAFKPDISCTLSKLRLVLRRNNQPVSNPLKLKIYGSTDNDIDTSSLLLDVGVIADSTSVGELYTPPWLTEKFIDLGNTVELTAGSKYWFVFSCDSYNVSNYWVLNEAGMVGSNYIGTPYTSAVKSSLYDNDMDLSSPNYEDDAFPCQIIGRVSNGIETLSEHFPLGGYWGSFATESNFRFFYDDTDRYFVQKFKAPSRSNPMQIHTMGMSFKLADPYVAGTSVWAEIRSVGAGNSVGSIISNGTSDIISDKHPGDVSIFTVMTQFAWTTPPTVQPDTEYFVVIKSDFKSTADFWGAITTIHSSMRYRGGAAAYIADVTLSSLVPLSNDRNLQFFQINGVEVVPTPPVIPPAKDFVLEWPLTVKVPDYDNIFSWPLTSSVTGEDLIAKWSLFTKAEQDVILRWGTTIFTDKILCWKLLLNPRTDFILPFSLLQSSYIDTILSWGIKLSSESILKYNILESNNTDTILNWPLTTRFNRDFLLQWKLWLTADWTLVWPLTYPITDTDIIKIPIMLSLDSVLPIGLMSEFSRSSTFRWDIENKIFENFILKNALFMSSDTTIKYSLNDLMNRIWKLVNEISNKIHKDTALQYAIKIESDCILLIPIRGPINRDFILRHGLLGQVEDSTTIKFDLLSYNPIEAETILRNALLGKPRFYKIIFS